MQLANLPVVLTLSNQLGGIPYLLLSGFLKCYFSFPSFNGEDLSDVFKSTSLT